MKSPDLAFAGRFKTACLSNYKLPTTQNDLGKVMSVSGAMISFYRSGEKLPAMTTAIRIAMICGVSVEWLLTGRGDMRPAEATKSESLTIDQVYDSLDSAGIAELFNRIQSDLIKSIADKNSNS